MCPELCEGRGMPASSTRVPTTNTSHSTCRNSRTVGWMSECGIWYLLSGWVYLVMNVRLIYSHGSWLLWSFNGSLAEAESSSNPNLPATLLLSISIKLGVFSLRKQSPLCTAIIPNKLIYLCLSQVQSLFWLLWLLLPMTYRLLTQMTLGAHWRVMVS